MSQSDAEWLAGLKVGDEVLLSIYGPAGGTIYPVTKAGAKAVYADGKWWSRETRLPSRPDPSDKRKLERLTAEVRERNRRIAAIYALSQAVSYSLPDSVPTDRIEAALALLQAEPSSGSPTP